jgi:hypothetical protein
MMSESEKQHVFDFWKMTILRNFGKLHVVIKCTSRSTSNLAAYDTITPKAGFDGEFRLFDDSTQSDEIKAKVTKWDPKSPKYLEAYFQKYANKNERTHHRR